MVQANNTNCNKVKIDVFILTKIIEQTVLSRAAAFLFNVFNARMVFLNPDIFKMNFKSKFYDIFFVCTMYFVQQHPSAVFCFDMQLDVKVKARSQVTILCYESKTKSDSFRFESYSTESILFEIDFL